jgi:hypothetical protein
VPDEKDFSPPALRLRTGTPVTDAFRRWQAKATPTELQAFADAGKALAANLRVNPLSPTVDEGQVRTEVTVLGPDDPNTKTVGWSCYERLGATIIKRGYPGEKLREHDIAPGDEVLVPALSGGYHVMVVDRAADGKLFAQSVVSELLAALAFDIDAWVCVGLINTRCIAKLELKK